MNPYPWNCRCPERCLPVPCLFQKKAKAWASEKSIAGARMGGGACGWRTVAPKAETASRCPSLIPRRNNELQYTTYFFFLYNTIFAALIMAMITTLYSSTCHVPGMRSAREMHYFPSSPNNSLQMGK